MDWVKIIELIGQVIAVVEQVIATQQHMSASGTLHGLQPAVTAMVTRLADIKKAHAALTEEHASAATEEHGT